MRRVWAAALALGLSAGPAAGQNQAPAFQPATPADWTRRAISALCPLARLDGLSAQAALPGAWLLAEQASPAAGRRPGRTRLRFALPGADEIEIERLELGGRARRFTASYFEARPRGAPAPRLQASADGGCVLRAGRRIRDAGPGARRLEHLAGDLATVRFSETLEAPWPPGRDPGGPRIALLDSGLAYDLPIFRDRLARGPDGAPLGYDFWDLDPLPYDGDMARGPFLPIRHGTAVASVLAREAPGAALIPYRYPRPDMTRLAAMVARAERAGARVIAAPLGSARRADWEAFERALEGRDLLAIVSAGNDGRDIDADPVWPAASTLENMIVVTSSDAFGRLAPGANWGAESVDVMLPAEGIAVTDFRGASGRASGSSYAVPRLAALAARILAAEPKLDADALKRRLLARAAPSPFEPEPRVAVGWIADPAAE